MINYLLVLSYNDRRGGMTDMTTEQKSNYIIISWPSSLSDCRVKTEGVWLSLLAFYTTLTLIWTHWYWSTVILLWLRYANKDICTKAWFRKSELWPSSCEFSSVNHKEIGVLSGASSPAALSSGSSLKKKQDNSAHKHTVFLLVLLLCVVVPYFLDGLGCLSP